MVEAYNNYVKQYDINNYDIIYKYKHSLRVRKICDILAKCLNLNEEDTYIITTIGLLHDIGRFEQIKLTDNYDDKEFDHAAYGAMILFKENLISMFNVDPKYYEIIEFSIRNHNKHKIEETHDQRKLFFAKLIRDADKIDIMDSYTYLKAYNITDVDDEVTNEVAIQFRKHESIDNRIRRTKSDKLLTTLAFVFDINFNESLKLISEQNFILELYNQLKDGRRFREYFEIVNDYIKERIGIDA